MSVGVLSPDAKVYVRGRWVSASEAIKLAAPHRLRGRRESAREVLAKRVIAEILRSPGNYVKRGRLKKLGKEVAEEMGLKRLGYRFLITRGILARPPLLKRYFLTEKAKQLYPDLFEK